MKFNPPDIPNGCHNGYKQFVNLHQVLILPTTLDLRSCSYILLSSELNECFMKDIRPVLLWFLLPVRRISPDCL